MGQAMNLTGHRETHCACILCVDNWTKVRVFSLLVDVLSNIMRSTREPVSAAKAQLVLRKIKNIK